VQKPFRFHQLKGNHYEGFFAIDVRTKRDPWRLILRPLDKNKKPFIPCHIDEIAEFVEIVEIREVSNHYE
jgi:proteic killer suppression protein